MIHDLYLRAHIVSAEKIEEKQPGKNKRPPKLWPDYALVWDTETTLDLDQKFNFGIRRFCQLQGTEYVAVQEGILYHDGLDRKNVETIHTYKQKYVADELIK